MSAVISSSTDRVPGTVVHAMTTPSDLLNLAIQQGADLDRLEKLMDLQQRWQAEQARMAFYEAVAAFKASPPRITKDKDNKQYGSKYTSLANLVNTANLELSKYGLSTRWDIKQDKDITVTCILSHSFGHSETVEMRGPPDTSGAKNSLQQIKSTITYLKGSTFEAVTGLASEENNLDDDGNAAVQDYDITSWRDAIADAASRSDLDSIASDLKGTIGIPPKAMKNIRALWAGKAKEFVK